MKLFLLGMVFLLSAACQEQGTDATSDSKTVNPVVACSKDLKICDDNQSVGRDINNQCEFFPCPAPSEKTTCQEDMKQCADGSFVFRDQNNLCEFKACNENLNNQQNGATLKPCTKDLKICENGNRVGRNSANNCEFHSCKDLTATKEEPMMCTQEVKQCPDGSYVGRDSYNNCAFKPCTDSGSNLQ